MVQCLFLVGKNATGNDLAPSQTQLGLLLPQLERNLLRLPALTINQLAPTTFSLMEFKTQQDIDLVVKIYANHPLLGDKLSDSWNVTIRREFNMTDDSNLFNQSAHGWPLWEGKMIYQFNSDYSKPRYWIDEDIGIDELCRRAEIEDYYSGEKWVAELPKLECDNFRLVYREVASGTNEVTLISSILSPHLFVGHTINVFTQWTYLPDPDYIWIKHFDEPNKLFILSLLNSFVINFLIRQKVTSHVSTYLINQLPFPRLAIEHPISQALVSLASRLICVDERFAPLWKELARYHPYTMQPEWDKSCAATDLSERAQLRTQIDAIVADLYKIGELDFAYILNTFPLLDRDQPQLPSEERSFITRDLALLTLFTQRRKTPPSDIIAFFAEAGVDIRQRTGPIVDFAERVRIATQELGAIAYQPSQRNKEENNGDEEIIEQDELDFYDEE